jgi:hypothetical protein
MTVRRMTRGQLVLLCLVAPSGVAWAWGQDGHRLIAEMALERLGTGATWERRAFVKACLEPDLRREGDPEEAPRHYVAIERYSPEFLARAQRARGKARLSELYTAGWPLAAAAAARVFAAVPPSRADYQRWRGDAASDEDLGLAFYAVGDAERALEAALAQGDGPASLRAAGDLCHYVGDLSQPLHNTANYRGHLSGNAMCGRGGSVHERFETQLVRRFRRELAVRLRARLSAGERGLATAAGAAESPERLAIAASQRAFGELGRLLAADRSVLADDAACDALRAADRDRLLYQAVGDLVVERMADAARLLGDLLARARRAAVRR